MLPFTVFVTFVVSVTQEAGILDEECVDDIVVVGTEG